MPRGSVVIMFMSHHVNHIIMSTTNHHVVGKRSSSGTRAWNHGWKHSWARNHVFFFRVKWLLWSPKKGVCFRGLGPRSAKVVDKKCAGLKRELGLHFKIAKNWRGRSTFGRWGRKNVHQTEARARFHIKIFKTDMFGEAPRSPHCYGCATVGPFGAAFLLCGFATGCDKTHWHSCAATLRHSWQARLQLEVAKRIVTAARKVALDHSATLVLCGTAAGGC